MADERKRSKSELKKLFTNLKAKGISDDMAAILIELCYNARPNMRSSGFHFPGGTDATISFDNPTRLFTIQAIDPLVDNWLPRFGFYSLAGDVIFHRRYETETIQLPNEEGLFCIYYDRNMNSRDHELMVAKNATNAELKKLFISKTIVSFIYWDFDNQKALTFGNDRYGSEWNPQLHWYLHETVHGKRRPGGLSLTGVEMNEDGSSDSHATFLVTAGSFWNDDFVIDVAASTDTIPVMYFDNGKPRFKFSDDWQIYPSAGRLYFNNGPILSEATELHHVAYHVFATNDNINAQHIISVMGTAQYEIIAEAFAGIKNEVNTIYGITPQQGLCYLGSVILQTSDTYTNAVKARVVGFSNDDTEQHAPITIAAESADILTITKDQELKLIGVIKASEFTPSIPVVGEIPNGLNNGVNKVFTLANTPFGSVALSLYPMTRLRSFDFTLVGKTITLSAGVTAPFEGECLIADYNYLNTES